MSAEGPSFPKAEAVEASAVVEGVIEPTDEVSDLDDPTGLPDLESLAERLEKGETFSDTSSEAIDPIEEDVRVAEHAYDYLLVVIDDNGHSIANGIIVLRTTDKVFDAWNKLIEDGNFDKEAYRYAALESVCAIDTSVYHITGQAFADMFDVAECSMADLSEISFGVEAMRRRIKDALEYERKENDKAMLIKRVTDNLIELEHAMGIPETIDDVQLSLAEATPKTAGLGRGNRTSHYASEWTDENRLEILKIYRDNPKSTHQARTDIFNSRFPDTQRSRNGTRQEYARLISKGITIAQLEAALSGASQVA